MTVQQLLNNIDSRELAEWQAFAQVEPIGQARGDFQTAVLAALTANASRDVDKKPDPFSPLDFLPDWWKDRTPQPEPKHSGVDNKAIAEMYAAAGFGTIGKVE